MPEKSAKNAIETELVPRPKREEIFEQISAVKDWTVVRRFVGDVFSHSTEDGLALAKRLNIEGAELAFCIMNSVFVAKHPDVFKQLTREVFTSGALEEIEASSTGEFLAGNIKKWHDALLENEKSGEWGDNIPSTEYIGSDENSRIKNQIDDFYAPLLVTRKLQPRRHYSGYLAGETVKGLKTGETRQLKSPEELADEALHQTELILLPAYYKSNVEEIINKYLKRNSIDESADFSGIEGMFLTEDQIKDQCIEHGIPFEEIKSQINGAKYSSITAKYKSAEAQKGILKLVNWSLEGRGQKVVFVRDSDRYEVVKDKEKKENDKRYKKIRVVIEQNSDHNIIININGVRLHISSQNTVPNLIGVFDGVGSLISERFEEFDEIRSDGSYVISTIIEYKDGYLIIRGERGMQSVIEKIKLNDEVVAEIEKTIPKEKAEEKEPKVIEGRYLGSLSGNGIAAYKYEIGQLFIIFQADGKLFDGQGNILVNNWPPFNDISGPVRYERSENGIPYIFVEKLGDLNDYRVVINEELARKIEGEEKAEEKEFDFAKFEQKTLDYMDKLLSMGADKSKVAEGLVGLDSERAWQLRNKLLNSDAGSRPIIRGLAGLDSDEAWKIRNKYNYSDEITSGLAGLDSERAWQERDKTFDTGHSKIHIDESLAAIDSERAWRMRENLMKEGASYSYNLAGLDSERAWRMRNRIVTESRNIYKFIRSVVGLDSESAWQMRDRFINEDELIDSVIISLAGLDSDRAWQIRDRFINEDKHGESIIRSLAGLDSDRAWKLRDKFLEHGKFNDILPFSLMGDYHTFIWLLIKNRQALDKEEKKLIELLNLLYHPTLDGINSHFNNEEKAKKRKQNPLSGSRVFSSIINKVIGEQPKEFLNTIPVKRDRNLAGVYAEQLAMRIFPEIRRKREQNAWRGFGGYAGLESGRESDQSVDKADYLNPRSSAEMLGGGAEQLNDNREIMELREPINEIIATSIYGRYNASSKRWEKVDFPIDSEVNEPIGETTLTLPSAGKLLEVSLPKPIEAKVIAERVKGFDAGGKEYDLKIEVNQLGEAKVVKKPKAVGKIVYSIGMPQIAEPLADLSARDYLKYKKQFETKNGTDLSVEIAGLPEDLELELIAATKDKSPKEQVVAIEQLVRRLAYYDRDNQEVSRLKAGKSLEEQLYVMEQRADELRQNKPELAEKLEGKRFAGVCADFAQITAILLRRAGFNSGTIAGFRTEDKMVRVRNAHATAFVVWPDAVGKNRVVSIDGTPGGVAGISMASIMEKEAEAIGKEKELSAEAMKEIQKIIDGLNELDAETIRKMSNGELEKVLNGILKYQVKESHLEIIERLLDYYWYTPIHNLDLQNPGQRGEAVMDLAGAVEAQREWLKNHPEKDEKPAGNKLMYVMSDFLRRFTVAGHTEDKYAAIELMDKIVELVQNNLSEIEKKAAYAIIAYLKAQNILGDKK